MITGNHLDLSAWILICVAANAVSDIEIEGIFTTHLRSDEFHAWAKSLKRIRCLDRDVFLISSDEDLHQPACLWNTAEVGRLHVFVVDQDVIGG